jgi:hypothetical protein
MKKVYWSASKGGKELEREFTTLERAEADVFANNYYIGCVVEDTAEDRDHFDLVASELEGDDDAEEYGEISDLEKYRYMNKAA